MQAKTTPKNLKQHLNGDPVEQPSANYDEHLIDTHAKNNANADADKKTLLQKIKEQPIPGDYFSQIYVSYETALTKTMMLHLKGNVLGLEGLDKKYMTRAFLRAMISYWNAPTRHLLLF